MFINIKNSIHGIDEIEVQLPLHVPGFMREEEFLLTSSPYYHTWKSLSRERELSSGALPPNQDLLVSRVSSTEEPALHEGNQHGSIYHHASEPDVREPIPLIDPPSIGTSYQKNHPDQGISGHGS